MVSGRRPRFYDQSVNSVAIVATIGGVVVGVASIVGNCYIAWLQRRQSVELAEKTHLHERELARGARLFERRASVYEEMLKLLYPWMERVYATERFMTFSGEDEPPEPPDKDEWQGMLVRLRTFGSVAVADAFEAFGNAVGDFYSQVPIWRSAREQSDDRDEIRSAFEALEAARTNVRVELGALERLVSQELESL
jgi:hypothetical protein